MTLSLRPARYRSRFCKPIDAGNALAIESRAPNSSIICRSRRGEYMKVKVIVIALAVSFAGAIVCSADSPHMGTWKLNEAKSKFASGATKNNTVVYEAAGDDIKVTVDGMDGSGAAVHSEWTGKFNGRYYAVTGSAT